MDHENRVFSICNFAMLHIVVKSKLRGLKGKTAIFTVFELYLSSEVTTVK